MARFCMVQVQSQGCSHIHGTGLLSLYNERQNCFLLDAFLLVSTSIYWTPFILVNNDFPLIVMTNNNVNESFFSSICLSEFSSAAELIIVSIISLLSLELFEPVEFIWTL